ncbi:hypothetical protein VTN96DRAFT_5881 [Rasamsonia emersonii]
MAADDIDQRLCEEQPLLQPWKPPKGFIWIQVAIFANVFLAGFDGTITASTYALISSEFNAANTASWLTTSYLITSTAFQPLYGRFSDIFGRRPCFFTCTVSFLIGCLGCALARDVLLLNVMRALTGIGGGGLMTMGTSLSFLYFLSFVNSATILATIINSDIIPFRHRGMYQAAQNGLHGFGSICGASLGGVIADSVGWRWCFLLQVPISVFALVVGYFVIQLPGHADHADSRGLRGVWQQVDLSGALLLVLGLSIQLVGLSLGGNELPWDNVWVITSLVASVVLLSLFVVVEAFTSAVPVIPLRMLRGVLPVCTQIANVCVGMAAYAVRLFPNLVWPFRPLTRTVPVHAPPVLPGRPVGFCQQGRRQTGYSIPGNAGWRPHCRHRHVALGQTGLSGAGWRVFDVSR